MKVNNLSPSPNAARVQNPAGPSGAARAVGQTTSSSQIGGTSIPGQASNMVFSLSQISNNHSGSMQTMAAAADEKLRSRQMGGQEYKTEEGNLIKDAKWATPSSLMNLIGDVSKVSLHRVRGMSAPTEGSQSFWFIGRDAKDPGRALVSIQVLQDKREVFELTYSARHNPLLARQVGHAKVL